ncbi:hypothetical protein D3C85_1097270 [compost metagenome]
MSALERFSCDHENALFIAKFSAQPVAMVSNSLIQCVMISVIMTTEPARRLTRLSLDAFVHALMMSEKLGID